MGRALPLWYVQKFVRICEWVSSGTTEKKKNFLSNLSLEEKNKHYDVNHFGEECEIFQDNKVTYNVPDGLGVFKQDEELLNL